MNLLLDTHIALWWFSDSPTLGPGTREQITTAENVYVSTVSVWEIEIKRAAGKLEAPEDVARAMSISGFWALDVTMEHAISAGRLPLHHNDPFDRMLVAQASLERLSIVSRDRHLAKYDVEVLAG